MDNKHGYLAEEDASKGILNKSLVYHREVFTLAIENRAAAMLYIDNHPSGPRAFTEGFTDYGTLG